MKYAPTDILEYIVMLVSEMAKRFSLTPRQAYLYIRRYDGVRLIEENYGIMHTLTFADAVDGVVSFCARKGGCDEARLGDRHLLK